MTAEAFLARVVAALDRAQIAYMVTGSFASSAHGQVRGTQDLDVVIAATAEQLRVLVAEFPSDQYYAEELDALEALRHESQFNIIDFGSSWKVDLIFRRHREFSRVEFERRRPHVIGETRVYVATPEDILIAKLEWAKIGESDRQIDDAAGIIATQAFNLDRAYVEHWVRELELDVQWQLAQKRAG